MRPRSVLIRTTAAIIVPDCITVGSAVAPRAPNAPIEGDRDLTIVRHGCLLRDHLPTRQIEALNAGVDGWTTLNELAWLKAEGLRYEPDLIVLMFYTGNDPG